MSKLGLAVTIVGGLATVIGSIIEVHETCEDCRKQFDEEMEDIRAIKQKLEEDCTKTS